METHPPRGAGGFRRSQDSPSGPGIPEALPHVVELVRARIGDESIDCLWIFPPLARGREEWGLVAISGFLEDPERRRVFTARYHAWRKDGDLIMEPELSEEGEAPPDRIPRVMEGVVRRSESGLGDPRIVEIRGDPELLEVLLEELRAAPEHETVVQKEESKT